MSSPPNCQSQLPSRGFEENSIIDLRDSQEHPGHGSLEWSHGGSSANLCNPETAVGEGLGSHDSIF